MKDETRDLCRINQFKLKNDGNWKEKLGKWSKTEKEAQTIAKYWIIKIAKTRELKIYEIIEQK